MSVYATIYNNKGYRIFDNGTDAFFEAKVNHTYVCMFIDIVHRGSIIGWFTEDEIKRLQGDMDAAKKNQNSNNPSGSYSPSTINQVPPPSLPSPMNTFYPPCGDSWHVAGSISNSAYSACPTCGPKQFSPGALQSIGNVGGFWGGGSLALDLNAVQPPTQLKLKPKCDCGTHITNGENWPDDRHSSYCSITEFLNGGKK